MKKILTTALVLANICSATTVLANTTEMTLTSPRTGISYVVDVPAGYTVVIKSEELKAADSDTAKRIVATNPALSPASQEKARLALANGTAK